jgi:preprotein translocase subunit SecY
LSAFNSACFGAPMKKISKTKSAFSSLFDSHELKVRLLWTIGLLILFRLAALVPLPLVPANLLASNPQLMQTLINMYDLFAGGSLATLSILALGIGPYISASIVLQLLTASAVLPQLTILKEEGAHGQRTLKKITRYLALVISVIESIGLIRLIASANIASIVPFPFLALVVCVSLAAGSMLTMYIAELISEKGIGNGSSLLICVGIIARLPRMVQETWVSVQAGAIQVWELAIMLTVLLAAGAMAFILQQKTSRLRVLGGTKSRVGKLNVPETELFLPMNPAGVMPIILASQILFFAQLALQFVGEKFYQFNKYLLEQSSTKEIWTALNNDALVQNLSLWLWGECNSCFQYSSWEYYVLYTVLILYFALFYSEISLPAKDIAENLRRSQRSIQGVKPGPATVSFLRKKIQKLALAGACAVAFIALLPTQIAQLTHVHTLLGIGSTSLIILTGVAADTKRQISACISSSRTHKRYLISPAKQSEPDENSTT